MSKSVKTNEVILEYLGKQETAVSFGEAKARFLELKGDGPCSFHAKIRVNGEVVFEAFPLQTEDQPAE
ncbi:hypothetical protein [Paenibacillus taichungensis]